MAFSIDMFSAKLVYCHTVSMTFDRAGYNINFALNFPIEKAFRQLLIFLIVHYK